MRAEKVNLLVALHSNKRLIHLPLIVVDLFISIINLNLIPLQERDLGNFTCTVQYPGSYFTVTLVEFLTKKLPNRFQVTESYRII